MTLTLLFSFSALGTRLRSGLLIVQQVGRSGYQQFEKAFSLHHGATAFHNVTCCCSTRRSPEEDLPRSKRCVIASQSRTLADSDYSYLLCSTCIAVNMDNVLTSTCTVHQNGFTAEVHVMYCRLAKHRTIIELHWNPDYHAAILQQQVFSLTSQTQPPTVWIPYPV